MTGPLFTGKNVIIAFGAVLFVTLLAVFFWSLTRPPVLDGPMPDYPPGPSFAAADAGRG